MKKILFVLNNMNIGGTEKAFLNMLDTMSPMEYDVTLMLLSKSGGFLSHVPEWVKIETMGNSDAMIHENSDPPLKIINEYLHSKKIVKAIGLAFWHVIFKFTGNRVNYYKCVLKNVKKIEKYDVAVAYAGPFDLLTVYVLYFVNAICKIQWIHFDVNKFFFNVNMAKRLYPQFNKIFVVSEEARNSLVKRIPAIDKKTEVFYNIVSPDKCRFFADKGIGYEDNYQGIRILTVGRLSEEKGQDIIPEITKELLKCNVDFKWYLVGDGKLRGEIERLAKSYNVSDRIVFLGTQENPYPFYKHADIYVQTSKHEGYCITLKEAKVFDLPIISTSVAGAYEQLNGREKSYVVDRSTPELVSAIKKIAEQIA